MNITPENSIDHKKLEDDVSDYLKQKGYFVCESTYHSVLPEHIIKTLQYNFTPTGLYLRGRADRIAIHPTTKDCFEWEAKTHIKNSKPNMSIEALPLCHHLVKSQLGVRCLYTYRDDHNNHEVGFWVTSSLPISCIMIPKPKWTEDGINWFTETFKTFFPSVNIIYLDYVAGTGDPFAIIKEIDILNFKHWKNELN